MDKDKQEICTMRIMFPVETDEKAIEYKKKIKELLSEIPDAHIHFTLSSLSERPPAR
ncbi:hypothetical protein ES703_53943 [subsurface metagenome]